MHPHRSLILITCRRLVPATVVAALVALVVAASAVACGLHAGHARVGTAALAGSQRADVQLRGCWMTVALVPRPASVLRSALVPPLDLRRTFYGSEPLLATWVLACDRARIGGRRAGRTLLAMVGVPVALTAPDAVPLANFFDHRLIRAETNAPVLAAALRRAGQPARLSPRMRYRHSPAGVVPFSAALVVPGKYGLNSEPVSSTPPTTM